MAAAFLTAGFEPWDVTMSDLLSGAIGLDRFQVIAFVGGFSFGDVLDSAKGWASVIRNHEKLAEEFDRFFARPDTASLGVCNGCQLMALLGIPGFDLADHLKPRFIHNTSGRFESRFATVRIDPSPSLFLKGMEDSTLGIWVAHGEGHLHVPDPATLDWIVENRLAPVRYVDPTGSPTETYPYNPNGSPQGIAALCSPDGRHLAIMPHPERCFQLRQWPWVPPEWTCGRARGCGCSATPSWRWGREGRNRLSESLAPAEQKTAVDLYAFVSPPEQPGGTVHDEGHVVVRDRDARRQPRRLACLGKNLLVRAREAPGHDLVPTVVGSAEIRGEAGGGAGEVTTGVQLAYPSGRRLEDLESVLRIHHEVPNQRRTPSLAADPAHLASAQIHEVGSGSDVAGSQMLLPGQLRARKAVRPD